MNKSDFKCGFCKQGVEAEHICGKLWHDKNTKCTSHQRCMQYSALLVQYQMKKFGGFKVKKVLKEQNRGKLLKCSICCKSGKKSKNNLGGGATAGCAISKCKKTFHFYCAKLDRNARTRRIVLRNFNDSDEPQILYRVFCSEEHEEMFNKIQKNIDYSEDTDNDEYKSDYTLSSDSSDSSDASEDEGANDKKIGKANKETLPVCETQDSGHLTSKQEKLNVEKNSKASLPKKRLNVCNDKNDENVSNAKKLKTSSHDDNHVICFVENAEHLVPSKFEVLVKRAKDLFDADASKVFLWKYNLERFTSQHMLYLLLDISQALQAKNVFEIKRLVCLLDNKDIERYEQLMQRADSEDKSNNNEDNKINGKQTNIKTEDKVQHEPVKSISNLEEKNNVLRQKIENNLDHANEKFNQLVGKYCLLNMPEDTHIVFLALCDVTDPHGEIRYHMKRPSRVKKETKCVEEIAKDDQVDLKDPVGTSSTTQQKSSLDAGEGNQLLL